MTLPTRAFLYIAGHMLPAALRICRYYCTHTHTHMGVLPAFYRCLFAVLPFCCHLLFYVFVLHFTQFFLHAHTTRHRFTSLCAVTFTHAAATHGLLVTFLLCGSSRGYLPLVPLTRFVPSTAFWILTPAAVLLCALFTCRSAPLLVRSPYTPALLPTYTCYHHHRCSFVCGG